MLHKLIAYQCIISLVWATKSITGELKQSPWLKTTDNTSPWARTHSREARCLTGRMTDVQSWVDEEGKLSFTLDKKSAIDLSKSNKAVQKLQKILQFTSRFYNPVRYISFAKCNLENVPDVFSFVTLTRNNLTLSESVEYLSFYGNKFGDSFIDRYKVFMNATGAVEKIPYAERYMSRNWYFGFQRNQLPRLLELDLRACSIQILNRNVFKNMPRLEALYLSDNEIFNINAGAFFNLGNLMHLDLSRNEHYDKHGLSKLLTFESKDAFKGLNNLISVDFSFTKLAQRNLDVLSSLGKNVTRLSLCRTMIQRIPSTIFNSTSLTYLDVSGNYGIFNDLKSLEQVKDTLKVLYADKIGLKTFNIFKNLRNVEILKLDDNEIKMVTKDVAVTLKNLQVLHLNINRVAAWFDPIYSHMPKLRLLSLKYNNINLLTDSMIYDFSNLNYLSLLGNFVVCNCQVYELHEMAKKSGNNSEKVLLKSSQNKCNRMCYHTWFDDVNEIIKNIKRFQDKQDQTKFIGKGLDISNDGIKKIVYNRNSSDFNSSLTLLDYNSDDYQCLLVEKGIRVSYGYLDECSEERQRYIDEINSENFFLLSLLVIPGLMMPALVFIYIFRRKLKYFWITVRNSATLSVINDPIEDAIYFYDVFVSYCHDDRDWVLNQLLPHVEKDCNVNVCLHERDFQVGLSILENIVSCIDRSKMIMLVLSRGFLSSHWCKFEMHLAQHRLLETRREDLILILLENIPRSLRPNTLHYLMLTKTYIVWPKEAGEETLFWTRLKKSLIITNPVTENWSTA